MLDLIRGLVRPTLTWLGFGVLTVIVGVNSLRTKTAPPDWYITMVAMMVAYWFAQRKPSDSNGEPPMKPGP